MKGKKPLEELRRELMRLYRDARIMEFFREMGRRGGLKGGRIGGTRAAENMSPQERHARAQKAAAASAKVRQKQARARKKGA